MTPPLRLILDTDPGGDDCFALLWVLSAVQRSLVELVAVTTVGGNVVAQQTFTNASQVLRLAGFSAITVGRGEGDAPGREDAAHIHGSDGMGNLAAQLPPATHDWATAQSSVQLLGDRLRAEPGAITVVAIGPLTNLAAVERQRPGTLRQAREIVVMGGAFQRDGNVAPKAEFNIWFDPEAADVVFRSQANLVIVPLDVTTQLRLTPAIATAIVATVPPTPLTQFITQLCEFMVSTAIAYRETAGVPAFLVHDAATIAYLLYPHLFQGRRAWVQVETQGEVTRGQTIFGDRHAPQTGSNAWVLQSVDAPLFFTYLVEDLKHWVQVCMASR